MRPNGPMELDSVSNPINPFGLPLGTVRGLLSLLICGFFWMVLLLPDHQPLKPLLAHFFMLALVLLTFSPYTPSNGVLANESQFLPWLLRALFVGGSIAVVAFVAVQYPDRLKPRLTPDPVEFRDGWFVFLAVTFGGFSAGKLLRFAMGGDNPVFRTMRAWLSVVGMLMLVLDLVFWGLISSAENKPEDPLRYFQTFELAIVAAYFGARA